MQFHKDLALYSQEEREKSHLACSIQPSADEAGRDTNSWSLEDILQQSPRKPSAPEATAAIYHRAEKLQNSALAGASEHRLAVS